MTFDSKEELYFSWYLEELEAAGYIDSWGNAQTYQLGEKITNTYTEQLKTKTKTEEQIILNGCEYTPDFEINWCPISFGIFYHEFPYIETRDKLYKIDKNLFLAKNKENSSYFNMKSIIEIKPAFDQNNMTRLNGINRKWMYQKYNIFVNLVKVPDIFKDTFTPKKFLLTDTGKQNRIIHFKTRTLEEYIKLKTI